jgi:chorismate mutase
LFLCKIDDVKYVAFAGVPNSIAELPAADVQKQAGFEQMSAVEIRKLKVTISTHKKHLIFFLISSQ